MYLPLPNRWVRSVGLLYHIISWDVFLPLAVQSSGMHVHLTIRIDDEWNIWMTVWKQYAKFSCNAARVSDVNFWRFILFYLIYLYVCQLCLQATRPDHIEGLIDQAILEKVLENREVVTTGLNKAVEITKHMYEALDSCINRVGKCSW